jgi:cytochrome c556
MLKRLVVLSAALAGVAAAGIPEASAPGVSAPDAIAARQATLDMSVITFRSMYGAMKAGRDAKSQSYPAAALAKWAKVLPRMFPPGTGDGDTSVSSQARAAIWRERGDFDQAAATYAASTARLAALAEANDTEAFTRQLANIDRACRSCHERYKEGPK